MCKQINTRNHFRPAKRMHIHCPYLHFEFHFVVWVWVCLFLLYIRQMSLSLCSVTERIGENRWWIERSCEKRFEFAFLLATKNRETKSSLNEGWWRNEINNCQHYFARCCYSFRIHYHFSIYSHCQMHTRSKPPILCSTLLATDTHLNK